MGRLEPDFDGAYAKELNARYGSKPSKQDQYKHDDEHKPEPAATVVAGSVEGPAAPSAEASEQGDD